MIWTNSGDSHFLEPDDLWQSRLPKALADLTPHAEKDPDGEYETVSVDGQIFRRSRPVEWCKSGRVSACGSVVATMP
ncbi:hypothetical protein MAV_2628 [Mycobacterium avium 104]|uniref:Uncharacterized protein n=1 Tax=Mycobacterium avium (strain 104) TaxID=243243 RepID=A0A0H2ZSR6_MYCA1|nr:hypothetical protein MAV_2628 [Mycobacterium avium 104]